MIPKSLTGHKVSCVIPNNAQITCQLFKNSRIFITMLCNINKLLYVISCQISCPERSDLKRERSDLKHMTTFKQSLISKTLTCPSKEYTFFLKQHEKLSIST